MHLRLMTTSVRFIPAGAGNTKKEAQSADSWTVHPCGRREHLIFTLLYLVVSGSSLRAQGTHLPPDITPLRWRFIPAGAGNTGSCSVWPERSTVHPCGRREHLQTDISCCCMDGSSLRAQGTPNPKLREPALFRFIPAGAGNTPILSDWL